MSKPIKRCLCCYNELKKGEDDFHPRCSIELFGTDAPPTVAINLKNWEKEAKKTALKRIAITGEQPKLSLIFEKPKDKTARILSVRLHGNYILKLPFEKLSQLPENEDLTMHLAGIAKIKTAQHSLIRLKSGELAYITKRFDRDKKGNKIAVEDLCQLTETLTKNKYNSSVEEVAETVKKHANNTGFEQIRLFELVLFCYLTGNAEMHLKNFALIENYWNEYELSPAYDLLNTTLLKKEEQIEFALSINGKKDGLTQYDFTRLGIEMRISRDTIEHTYKRFKKLLGKWRDCVEKSFLSDHLKKKYIELLEQRQQVLNF